MLPQDAKAIVATQLLPSKNAANTAEASGAWVAMPATEGCIVVVQSVGAVTGNLAGSLLTSANSNGAGNEAMAFDDGNNFTLVSAANNVQAKSVDARKNQGYIKYVGTVGTGPVVVDVVAEGRPKTTT